MKKLVTVLLAALVLSGVLSGCGRPEEEIALPAGSYEMVDSDAVIAPYIQIEEDGTFLFFYSALSSHLAGGGYTVENGRVALAADDGMYTYVFLFEKGDLVFRKKDSSEIRVYEGEPEIRDGAVFRRREEETDNDGSVQEAGA